MLKPIIYTPKNETEDQKIRAFIGKCKTEPIKSNTSNLIL